MWIWQWKSELKISPPDGLTDNSSLWMEKRKKHVKSKKGFKIWKECDKKSTYARRLRKSTQLSLLDLNLTSNLMTHFPVFFILYISLTPSFSFRFSFSFFFRGGPTKVCSMASHQFHKSNQQLLTDNKI